jgi:hypothetical protein
VSLRNETRARFDILAQRGAPGIYEWLFERLVAIRLKRYLHAAFGGQRLIEATENIEHSRADSADVNEVADFLSTDALHEALTNIIVHQQRRFWVWAARLDKWRRIAGKTVSDR